MATRRRRKKAGSGTGRRDAGGHARLAHALRERVKELTLLRTAARLLQDDRLPAEALLQALAAQMPAAWQYPALCEARIRYGEIEAATPGWRAFPRTLSARFETRDGRPGEIEVAYREARSFLRDERALLAALAEMLALHLERRRAENALRNREALFRAAFENAAIGITLTSMEGRLLQCNPMFARMLGYEQDELRRLHFSDITHPADRAANETEYARLVAGEIDHFRLEKRYLRKDGAVLWGQLAVSLVKRDSGAPLFTVGMVQDITTRRQAEERVAQLAYYDPVTELPNRASLQRALDGAIAAAAPARQPLALLLVNLSNFGDINNTLGHRNGDALLRAVARGLRETLRGTDLVASLGGDEFAVLLGRLAQRSDIDLVMGKIEESLRQPAHIAGVPVQVESSIGIALYPDHGDSAELLWQHADVALRAARRAHRGSLLYSREIDHYEPQRLALLGELAPAIERGELVLHYQPKVDLASGRAVAVEALVRWQHPAHGLLAPDRFLVDAERTQLINPLARWVLAHALAQCRAWDEAGLPLGLSVNLSARNLLDPQLAATILRLAAEARFPLERLTMEITESAIMADPVLARNVLGELHGAGILISIDDFGIGQSSLAYVKDLPIGKMKIDKSFVMALGEGRNLAIVRAAIELGRSLGLQVTAEGVEDERAMRALRELGCDLGQGYFFSRPLPAGGLEPWLRGSRWACRAQAPA
jgi:diguanylate cyclase (GGDEF)-like protein/PAS domain S-box-containing protein